MEEFPSCYHIGTLYLFNVLTSTLEVHPLLFVRLLIWILWAQIGAKIFSALGASR